MTSRASYQHFRAAAVPQGTAASKKRDVFRRLDAGLPEMVFSMFLPVIAQVYWIWALWPATGTLSHPLTLLCVAFLALLGIRFFAQYMFAKSSPPQTTAAKRMPATARDKLP